MGELLPRYKRAVIDDIITSISTNNAFYFAFGAGPVPISGEYPALTTDSYSTKFLPDWTMLFGKKLSNTDVMPVVKYIPWVQDTVYARYDDKDPDLLNKNFYVVTEPVATGGWLDFYVCIDNNDGAQSTVQPDITQATTFSKSDGYKWRYVASVSFAAYTKFATAGYVPIQANNTLKNGAALFSGVDTVVVANGGADYRAYANGIIQSNPAPTLIQIESTKSLISNFYANCGLYVYTVGYNNAQLLNITGYTVNGSGNWIHLDTEANTNSIIPGVTKYEISPRVIFQTDGASETKGYSVVNAVSNTIHKIVITDTGTDVTRANVHIQQAFYGSGANLYAVLPPPGGYGYDPVSHLNVQGISVAFNFANSEGGKIPTNISYNKIGIIKNPHMLNPGGNTQLVAGSKSVYQWTNSHFSQVLQATVTPSTTYAVGTVITGTTSKAQGIVAFSNSTTLYLTGDKSFANNEFVSSPSGLTCQININTRGDIYVKDVEPVYVQQLNDVPRSDSQTETYKLLIQI